MPRLVIDRSVFATFVLSTQENALVTPVMPSQSLVLGLANYL